jgi:hypothetical protein
MATELQLLPIQVGARGNKSAPLLRGNAPVTFKPKNPTQTPFEPGVYGDPVATRKNLELRCDQEDFQQFLNELDEFVIHTLAYNPQAYFGKKKLTIDEIRNNYKPSITIRQKDGAEYPPTCRCKINVGNNPIKCWTPEKTLRDQPEQWRACQILPLITARSVWFMGQGQCGITYEVSDACITELAADECPF